MARNIYPLIILYFFFACKDSPKYISVPEENKQDAYTWSNVQGYYVEHLSICTELLEELKQLGFQHSNSKEVLKKARMAYKKAEPYAAYLKPEIAELVNGPPIPVFREDSETVLPAIGLQKIEEDIYKKNITDAAFQKEVEITIDLITNLRNAVKEHRPNPKRFYIAIHQQLLRIVTHSISGFDTPESSLGIMEANISLKSLWEVYKLSIQPCIRSKNEKLDAQFEKEIKEALMYLSDNNEFVSFNRFAFLRDYFNPLTTTWVKIRQESGIQNKLEDYPFNMDALTFFNEDFFNVEYFMPAVNNNYSQEQIELGEDFFYDPNLSQNNKMSCATCHLPEKAFAGGVQFNLDNRGEKLKRNTPTLLNSIFQKAYFWDGRSNSILDQVSSVFSNEVEFNMGMHKFSSDILKDTVYNEKLEKIFGTSSGKSMDIVKSLSAYVSTLNNFNSKFDRNIRNEEKTFTDEEVRGFNLYMGKALCATCHFLPLTNGTLPPFYKKSEREVLGVPESASNKQLDDDLGFYWRYKAEIHRAAFKTPTLRNISETSPYMHNGIYKSLEEVIEFYNAGGGAGLGFDIPNQTLPSQELNLNSEEVAALVSFMKTLKGSDSN